MDAPIKRLGSQVFVYGIGYGLTRLLQFALLPVYTRYLTTAEYGVFALLVITGQLATILSQVGMGSAMFRETIYEGTDRRTVESTVILSLVIVATVVLAVAWSISPWLSDLLFKGEDYVRLLRLTFLTSAIGIFEAVLLARLRIEQRPSLYSSLAVARFLIGFGLTIYFIVILDRGLTGLVEATLLTTALFGAVYAGILLRGFKPVMSVKVLKRLLRFGGPLVPGNTAGISLISADRYIMQAYRTTSEVGVYSLGYTVGQVINLFVNAVQLAWPAQMFEIAKQPDAQKKLAVMLTYYVAVVGFAALAVSVFADDIIRLMATPAYYEAARVVPWICVAYVFFGAGLMVNSGLAVKNKMKYSGMILTAAAALNLVLNVWLIPAHGMMGAAWATLASYLILALLLTVVNRAIWPIPYEYPRLIGIAVLWCVLYATGAMLPDQPTWLRLPLKTVTVAAFPLVLWMLRGVGRGQEPDTP